MSAAVLPFPARLTLPVTAIAELLIEEREAGAAEARAALTTATDKERMENIVTMAFNSDKRMRLLVAKLTLIANQIHNPP